MIWLLVQSCQAVVYLATSTGLTPVIPLFTIHRVTYPVDSPTGLAGRAVAALYGYKPGYLHAWMPEDATEEELARFSYRQNYGPVIFERWRVDCLDLKWDTYTFCLYEKRMRHVRLNKAKARSSVGKLSYWKRLQHLDWLADTEKEAEGIFRGNAWFPNPHVELICQHFGRLEVPLIQRIQGFAAEAVYAENEADNADSFLWEMNKWAIHNHAQLAVLPLAHTKLSRKILFELLLMIGWKALMQMNWTFAQLDFITKNLLPFHDCLYQATALPWPVGAKEYELMMLQNLKHEKEPLHHAAISWLFESLDQPGPCHLLAVLHLSDESLQQALLQKPPTRPMHKETGEYLRKTNISAGVLVKFGFYRVNEVRPHAFLEILRNQSTELMQADRDGFMALCARLTPLVSEYYDLMDAPWPVLLGLIQMNRRVTEVMIALLRLPSKRLSVPFEQEFQRLSFPDNIDLEQVLPHIEMGLLLQTDHAKKIVLGLINLDQDKMINYLCIEWHLGSSAQDLMLKVLHMFKIEELWKGRTVRSTKLKYWAENCRLGFREYFAYWLEERYRLLSEKQLLKLH